MYESLEWIRQTTTTEKMSTTEGNEDDIQPYRKMEYKQIIIIVFNLKIVFSF